jgi:hypothetical protein
MPAGIEETIKELATLYGRLRPATRRMVWALLAFELVLIAAVQRDIQRQPPSRVRGPKLLWRVVATQNLIGPAAYLALGRRRSR